MSDPRDRLDSFLGEEWPSFRSDAEGWRKIDGNGTNIRAASTLVLSVANNCATVVWDAANTRWLARVTT